MKCFRQWKWHFDEVEAKFHGEMHYLWRAVDQDGEVLESYVTKTRDQPTALSFMKKALRRHGTAEVIATDGLRSYRAAMTELSNTSKQRWDAGQITGLKTATCRFKGESEPC